MAGANWNAQSDRILGYIASGIFWAVIGTICLLLKLQNRRSQGDEGRSGVSGPVPKRIVFCENGAGYGGAIISLAAFIEKIPAPFEPVIYTTIRSEHYARLTGLGLSRHICHPRLIDTGRLTRFGAPFVSTIDNFFNLLHRPRGITAHLSATRSTAFILITMPVATSLLRSLGILPVFP